MDILKASLDWAKGEVFSSLFFVLFALIFLFASLAFWQLSKTDLAKAYIIPTLVAGSLLLIIGLGLLYNYQSKITNFPIAYHEDALKFMESELAYVNKTLSVYKNIVFTVIPIIIAFSAIIIIFVDSYVGRASLITTIALMAILLLFDGTASARLVEYKEVLLLAMK